MANPFRSESAAFRFVLVLIAYFAAIVVAKWLGGNWAGYATFAVLTLAVLAWVARGGRKDPLPRTAPAHRGADDERRILVIANETVGGDALHRLLRERAEAYREEVLLVAPALNSPLRHWASDDDGARRAAQERVDRSIARLADLGVSIRGEVGDGEPLQAIEDALRTFGADEVIISTHPEGRSNWLERGLVDAARERFDVPITHVVVDLERGGEETVA